MLVAYFFMLVYVILITLFTFDHYVIGNEFSKYAADGIL